MGSTISVIKTLIIPAITSLILFILLTYVVIPGWRRYRNRYSQYLPLDSISSRTSGLRSRITARLAAIPIPARLRPEGSFIAFASRASSDAGLDDDEVGEELSDVDDDTRRVLERVARTSRQDNTRRLSRDLEEGFRDDSDDEQDRITQSANLRR
ncbi:hypothetical protein BGZ63DRAFT_237178 [Mariannaea sp. PMI_226]|nr:hypothetical protein BGZ63DRAFT_237178 [Mariannaea sp. PMI_226]